MSNSNNNIDKEFENTFHLIFYLIIILLVCLLFIIFFIPMILILIPIFIINQIFYNLIPFIVLNYTTNKNNRLFNRIYLKRIIRMCIGLNRYNLFENLIYNKLKINENNEFNMIIDNDDINIIIDSNGNNMITRLCKYRLHEDSENIFKLLIDNGINTNHCDNKGNNSLINLTSNKLNKYSLPIIKLLVGNEIGIDMDQISNDGHCLFTNLINHNLTDINNKFIIDIFKYLINNNLLLLDKTYGKHNDNMLNYICRYKYLDHKLIHFFITETNININFVSKDRKDALKLLCPKKGNDNNIKLLIDKGIMDNYNNYQKINIFDIMIIYERNFSLIQKVLPKLNMKKYEFLDMYDNIILNNKFYLSNQNREIIIKYINDNKIVPYKIMKKILSVYGDDETINELCIHKIKENEIYYSILLK